jgi:hypothetical protein
MSDTPNSTVYISNLYEKLKKDGAQCIQKLHAA